MKLHIFNPEHDLALVSSDGLFTPPHAARDLRTDLGFIPSLWADDGDLVLVDDTAAALESVRHVKSFTSDVLFVTQADLRRLTYEEVRQLTVCPWGWDATLVRQLIRANDAFSYVVPDNVRIDNIREMSNRRFASAKLLPYLCTLDKSFVGQAVYLDNIESISLAIAANGKSVIKAPWSCSGRGVRYVEGTLEHPLTGWCRNVLSRQCGLMVEPYYNKVQDFGMEFMATADGRVEYSGLSLFKTVNGVYVGSIVAQEEAKSEMLSRYVDMSILQKIKTGVINRMPRLLKGEYVGPFGIDLMIVAGNGDEGFLIHPCVELNLRRTMGHVALAMYGGDTDPQRLMSIRYDGKYHLRISTTNENVLNTSLAM